MYAAELILASKGRWLHFPVQKEKGEEDMAL